MTCWNDLCDEFGDIMTQNALDDEEDLDGNGIADVKEMTKDQLIQRKFMMVVTNCNPDKITNAIAGLYQG